MNMQVRKFTGYNRYGILRTPVVPTLVISDLNDRCIKKGSDCVTTVETGIKII